MRLSCRRLFRAVCAAAAATLLVLRLAAVETSAPGGTLLERAYALDAAPGDQRDAAGAARLYADAAAGGDAFAHMRLGHLCEMGDGVPQDYAAARSHYQAAVDLGLTAARVPLAVCHLEGWGGPADRQAFVREITLAAEAGEAAAQSILGGLCAAGLMVPQDMAASVAWLEKAAKSDAFAQHHLGLLAEQAQRFVTARNLEIARTWYQLSAEQEYLTGMRAMARTFIARSHGTPDWAMFNRWLKLADEAGDSEAPYIFALVEMATDANEARARTWLKTAATRGNFRATEVLDFVQTGQSLREALNYVLTEQLEDRYVRRLQRRAGNGPTRPPVPIKTVLPLYPLALRVTGVTGTATMRFTVDTSGRVQDIRTVSTTHPLFAERASAALREWRFEPAREEGHRVNCDVQLDFPFLLDEETVDGVDGLLAAARSRAQDRGPEFEALAAELRIARPITPLATPAQGNAAANERRYALVLLALDAAGKPLRGLVLDASPAALGDEMLAIALAARFQPRSIAGQPVPSNVLLPFFSGAMLLPTPGESLRK